MKRKLLIIIPIILLIVGLIISLVLVNQDKRFFLTDYLTNSNHSLEIDLSELNNMIKNKESFAIFVYQPACSTSSEFEQVLEKFQNKYNIKFLKIAFSKLKEQNNFEYLKYYPSFIIFNNGKMVDYLDANSDEDTNNYQSLESFEKWFTTYVKLKDNNASNSNQNQINEQEDDNSKNQEEIDNTLENIDLDIIRDNNKVNIYFFWGNGCPHCQEEHEFFEDIKDEYKDKYNLYTFEVWYDEYNKKVLNTFAKAMGDKAKGVPYTIIGNKSFSGFNSSYKDKFINAIEEESKSTFDVYFDVIKK